MKLYAAAVAREQIAWSLDGPLSADRGGNCKEKPEEKAIHVGIAFSPGLRAA
ncbi:MAG TPA: hypothetical protein VGN57_05345 [Pirellulaceae bacterium]|nr:hypothetical protein [Pirellulaceae bacterium]